MLTKTRTLDGEIELCTFYVGDLLLGIPIEQVEEITRRTEVTPVPGAAPSVRGIMSLRGDVVTVLDLRAVLGLEAADYGSRARNIIVPAAGERIGLIVDRVADVVRARASELLPPPANIAATDTRFFQSVYRMENELLVILDVTHATAVLDCAS